MYRRNLLDVIDTVHEAEKKRKIKASSKFKQRSGAAYGSLAQKLDKKNKKYKESLDQRERKEGFLQDDLIMLWSIPKQNVNTTTGKRTVMYFLY